ncbi:hypothetical protein B0H11DRAFT_1914403 [Mycena galericulata]|nr:hypothetical protein B0H11DRAFT_1914403 [Mycena galericulata]
MLDSTRITVRTRPASGLMSFVGLVRTRFSANIKSDHSPDIGCSRDPRDYGQVWHITAVPLGATQKILLFVLRTKLFLYYTPAGSIFYRIPDKVNLKDNVAEVSSEMALKYKTLLLKEKGLRGSLGWTQFRGVENRI